MGTVIKRGLAAAFTLLFAAVIWAADGGKTSVAVFGVQEAILESGVWKERRERLKEESEFKANFEEAATLDKGIREIREQLGRDGGTMTQRQLSEATKKLQAKQKDLEFVGGKIQAAQREALAEVTRQLSPKIQALLKDLVERREVKVLLDKQASLFVHSDNDLTSALVELLNESEN